MAIEAPISKYKRTNFKIYIVACLVIGIWCIYDGYLNKAWIETVSRRLTWFLIEMHRYCLLAPPCF